MLIKLLYQIASGAPCKLFPCDQNHFPKPLRRRKIQGQQQSHETFHYINPPIQPFLQEAAIRKIKALICDKRTKTICCPPIVAVRTPNLANPINSLNSLIPRDPTFLPRLQHRCGTAGDAQVVFDIMFLQTTHIENHSLGLVLEARQILLCRFGP